MILYLTRCPLLLHITCVMSSGHRVACKAYSRVEVDGSATFGKQTACAFKRTRRQSRKQLGASTAAGKNPEVTTTAAEGIGGRRSERSAESGARRR